MCIRDRTTPLSSAPRRWTPRRSRGRQVYGRSSYPYLLWSLLARVASGRRGYRRPGQVFVAAHQFHHERKRERAEERPDHAEKANAGERSDERQHWVNAGYAAEHDESRHVVDVRRDGGTEDGEYD